MKKVSITTDGSCEVKTKEGGWCAILKHGVNEKIISGKSSGTTCNRMEVTAVVEALRMLREPCEVEITTDSMTVIHWATNCGPKYRSGKKKKQPMHYDLVEPMLQLMDVHRVKFIWVKGHSGHPDNERADYISRGGKPLSSRH